MRSSKGITLIALVITIIILLILAGISMNLLLGNEGLIEKAKWSAFETNLAKIEEGVLISQKIGDDGKISLLPENVFDGEYDNKDISDTLKKNVVEARENNPDSQMTKEEVDEKYKALKNDKGVIEGLYYVKTEIAGKEKAYLYDTVTNTVLKVKGEKIFGKIYHLCKIGRISSNVQTGGLDINKPNGPDLSNHKGLEEGWIPIYTVENYKKIATEEQNYDIYNLSNTKVGTYNMSKDAKYRLMNDIDFANETVDTIKGFKGTFDGNGYYIKNIKVDTTNSTEQYYYYSVDNFKTLNEETEIGVPAGLFDRTEFATIENLGIDNANVTGTANVGILAGEIIETNITNCLIKNSVAISNGESNAGAVGGLVGWTYKKDNPCNITQVAMDNVKVKGASVTSGMIAVSASDIIIRNCKLENSEIDMQATNLNTMEAQGGILGYSLATNTTTLDNCYVGNTTFKNNLESAIDTARNTCGGILGSTHYESTGEHTVSVTNCSIEDSTLAAAYNCGGICGAPMYGITTLIISDCNSQNTKGAGRTVGGICGFVYLYQSKTHTLQMTNCRVNNFTVKKDLVMSGTVNIAGILGSIYMSSYDKAVVQIDNCDVANSTISYNSPKSDYCTVAGIVGTAYAYRTGTIKNCDVKNTILEITLPDCRNKNLHVSGILGNTGISVENCNIDNSKILLLSNTPENAVFDSIGEMQYPTVTGIVMGNHFLGQQVSVTDCNITNSEIRTNQGIALGVFACGNGVDIQRINIEDSLIQGRSTTAGVTQYIGSKLNIDTINIKNTQIISEERHASGIVTFAYSFATVNNCNIDACTIKNLNYVESNGLGKYSYAYAGNVAGIVGIANGCCPTNCTVKNTRLENNYMNTGGIVGFLENSGTIKDCSVENITIVAKGQNAGGICGYDLSYNTKTPVVSACSVNGGTIIGKSEHTGGITGGGCSGSTYQDCSVNNLEIQSSNSFVGGIIGKNYLSKIDNCDVTNCKISGKDKSVGGISGEMYSSDSIITNCDVSSSEITITGGDAKAIGGIVGNGSNQRNTGLTIDTCNVLNTKISGVDYVGGISGVATANIKNCKVDENTTITGRNSVGGIQGFGGILGTTTASYTIWSSAEWKTFTFNSKAVVNATLQDCIVQNSQINGSTNINYIQGQNSYFEETWTEETGEDTITNCTYDNVTLNTI